LAFIVQLINTVYWAFSSPFVCFLSSSFLPAWGFRLNLKKSGIMGCRKRSDQELIYGARHHTFAFPLLIAWWLIKIYMQKLGRGGKTKTKQKTGDAWGGTYLKETIEGRVLCLMSFWTSEMWENDMESRQSSTRSAPSALAFSMEACISSMVSHSSGVQSRRLFLNAMWEKIDRQRRRSKEDVNSFSS
jgi:hypothetical protein